MASFKFQAACHADADGDDWMAGLAAAETSLVTPSSATNPGSAPPVQRIGLGPQVKPTSMNWMLPVPSAAGPVPVAPCPKSKAPTSTARGVPRRGDWDKQAAVATAAAHKAASASEAAVRLANLAVKQMAETRTARSQVTPVKSRGQKRPVEESVETPTPPTKQKPCRLASPVRDQPKGAVEPGSATEVLSTESTGEEPSQPSTLPVEPDKEKDADADANTRGTRGTFAGNRPPKDPEALEIFEYKKHLFFQSREELEKKYPGKVISMGATAGQLAWWAHLRTSLALAKKGRGKPTKAQTRAAIEAAGKTWKAKLAKFAAV